jgi:hypothetical protein
MLENKFQKRFIETLIMLFPGIIILKNDSGYKQGFPDLTLLYREKYAVLEMKKSEDEPYQPNQEYYLKCVSDMNGFSRTVYPSNWKEVLDELQELWLVKDSRNARLLRS